MEGIDRGLDAVTPVELWQRWIDIYRPMADRGLSRFESPATPAIAKEISDRRFLQKSLLAVAGAPGIYCAALAQRYPSLRITLKDKDRDDRDPRQG